MQKLQCTDEFHYNLYIVFSSCSVFSSYCSSCLQKRNYFGREFAKWFWIFFWKKKNPRTTQEIICIGEFSIHLLQSVLLQFCWCSSNVDISHVLWYTFFFFGTVAVSRIPGDVSSHSCYLIIYVQSFCQILSLCMSFLCVFASF